MLNKITLQTDAIIATQPNLLVEQSWVAPSSGLLNDAQLDSFTCS